tara:strand:+ start:202 stop:609 length:408 start_codon:yes stop_codon:yes gene_type:complete
MTNKNQTHERLIKKTFETTKSHRYFFIVFFTVICFNLLNLENRNFYFLSFFLIVLIVSNIFVLINNNKVFKFISDLPVNLISRVFDLSGTLMLGIFYFIILTPFSVTRKKTKNYSFSNKMWVDVEKDKIDYENGF